MITDLIVVDILVTPKWLESKLGDKNIKIIDASWCMPNEKKDIYADHKRVRLPNSVLFGIFFFYLSFYNI